VLAGASLVLVFGIQLMLHYRIEALAEYRRGAGLMRYDYRDTVSRAWLHAVQGQGESLEEFGARCFDMVTAGPPDEGTKSETWTDARGNTHQFSLDWDPVWTEEEWCARYDAGLRLFRGLFPCD